MKKVILVILILFLAGGGCYYYTQTNSSTEEKTKNESKKAVEYVCEGKLIDTFFYTSNKEKISFAYPDCVSEYVLSNRWKSLHDENSDIKIDVSVSHLTLDNYLSVAKTYYNSLKNIEGYVNFSDEESPELTTVSGSMYKYYKYNYTSEKFSTVTDYEFWYVAAPLDDERIFKVEIVLKNVKMTNAEIVRMMNFELEKNVEFSLSGEVNDMLQGTLKQNIINSYQNGYQIDFTLSDEYKEQVTILTSIDHASFKKESNEGIINVDLSLVNDFSSDSANELVKKNLDVVLLQSQQAPNFHNTGVQTKTIGDKEIYYYIIDYDVLDAKGQVSYTHNQAYLFYLINDSFGYEVTLYAQPEENGKNLITEALLEEFLAIKVTKY